MADAGGHITEEARTVPVLCRTDVLVAGGGPGGLAAAVAAARSGARTVLVERHGCFGGVITQTGVETVAWYRRAGTVDLEGIGREFERRAEALGGATPDVQSKSLALDTELFKVVADRMVLEAGVEPLLHCLVAAPIVEDGVVRGVVTESKSGRRAILAERVIDATGDADLAVRAGAPCRTLAPDKRLGVTVTFSCSGVDKARVLDHVARSAPTYGDWTGRWYVQTDGKEDRLFSPYLQEPFDRAR
ncbi:MAG: FAD-dependent oxidoreductase, partial [Acidobacteriota bacterium]|nr:FAD-dependent oxidoreductase [Acidobacteriota bacterium]